MDWQTFLQWLFIVAAGASIFGAFLAWAARENGKETRRFLGELLSTEGKETRRFIGELINKIDERAEERHREVIELLKRGFGEVIIEMRKS